MCRQDDCKELSAWVWLKLSLLELFLSLAKARRRKEKREEAKKQNWMSALVCDFFAS
jgi:hypothetical protein